MKTLNQIHFIPPATGTLYFADGLFHGHQTLPLESLPGDMQEAVGGAMAWLAGMAAPMGFASISQVWMRRVADVVTEWSEPEGDDPPEPVATSPAFVAEITGTNAEGLSGSTTINSVPGPETSAMGQLWEMFQAGLNA
jgi:hypothetical protein